MSNIYKCYLAYEMIMEERESRKKAKEAVKEEGASSAEGLLTYYFHEGGIMMSMFKGRGRSAALVVTIFLSVLIMGGCATTVKYSYDTKIGFSGLKSYRWAPSSAMSARDSLLERNVQVLAEHVLGQKGFTKVPEKADLVISMNYESEYGSSQYSYQLRMLTLNIYTSEPKDLVWRGTASGTINTDAASGDLKQAVQGILLNFPPN